MINRTGSIGHLGLFQIGLSAVALIMECRFVLLASYYREAGDIWVCWKYALCCIKRFYYGKICFLIIKCSFMNFRSRRILV